MSRIFIPKKGLLGAAIQSGLTYILETEFFAYQRCTQIVVFSVVQFCARDTAQEPQKKV